jgi:hypothetical protein
LPLEGTNLIKQLDLDVSGQDNEVYLMEIDSNNRHLNKDNNQLEQEEEMVEEALLH